MDMNKINKVSSMVNLVSLIVVIIGLVISSMNLAIISLIAFCLSGQISVVSGIQEKIRRLSIVDKLLRNGVFDDVLDIPDEVVEELKL